jgi:hypothetical protein
VGQHDQAAEQCDHQDGGQEIFADAQEWPDFRPESAGKQIEAACSLLFKEVDQDVRIGTSLAAPSVVERDHLVCSATRAELVRQVLQLLASVGDPDDEPGQLPAQCL